MARVKSDLDLAAIAAAVAEVEAAKEALIDAVVSAKAHGQTWTAIAEPLGVTRQGACERFKPYIATKVTRRKS